MKTKFVKKNKPKVKDVFGEDFGDLLEFCDEILAKTELENQNDEEKPKKNVKKRKEVQVSDDEEIIKMFEDHKRTKNKMAETKISNEPPKNAENIQKIDADLRKSVKTIINKISDKNMENMINEMIKLFQQHGMNLTTNHIIDLLIEFVCQPQLLPDRFILTYALFLSILHFLKGNELMATFLARIFEIFCTSFDQLTEDSSLKTCQNSVAFICSLYYFENIGYLIIDGLLKKLILRFSDQDIEMILQILKYNGFCLRKNNPAGLKEIIQSVHTRCKNSEKISLRASFMVESITAIQHNNPNKLTDYDPDLFESFKKILRSLLKDRQIEGTILNTQLEQLLSNNSTGKWWLVGSAFSGPSIQDGTTAWIPAVDSKKSDSEWSRELIQAAKNQNYKDKTRIDIFCTMVSSENTENAFSRLNSLGLKSKERDLIIRVIIETCLQESTFNNFYSDLIETFVKHHRTFSSSLHFAIRDQLRKLSDFKRFSRENLIKLIIELLSVKCLKISILKIIDFNKLEAHEIKFYKELFGGIILNSPSSSLKKIFSCLTDEKYETLREDILCFILYHFHNNNKMVKNIKVISSIAHGIENPLIIESENIT